MLQPSRRTRCAITYLSMLTVFCIGSPAYGHAALTSSDPENGARLDAAPARVTVNYAEPPTTDSKFSVLDGCDRDVTDSVEILNDTIEATLRDGQPGRWTVEWSVVSAVDGHLTRDNVSFRVSGETDCSQAPGDDGATETAGPVEPTDSGSSLPLVPIAVATAVIIGIAAAIRLSSKPDPNP